MILKKHYATPELVYRRWTEAEILTDVISASGTDSTTHKTDPFADFFADENLA